MRDEILELAWCIFKPSFSFKKNYLLTNLGAMIPILELSKSINSFN